MVAADETFAWFLFFNMIKRIYIMVYEDDVLSMKIKQEVNCNFFFIYFYNRFYLYYR